MRSLLVTGGTGSLGRAVVAQALVDPAYGRVVVFSSDEFKQAMMHEQIGRIGDEAGKLRFFIGNIRDTDRLADALVGITDVVHAAALKWLGDGVYNPGELVQTNVLGTMNVIRAATARSVERVLCVTSDKGCAPVNIYGATKFLAEAYAVAQNAVSFPRGTRVACLRLGNLLWSRGSVAHRFRERIEGGHPPDLTSPDMTRFGIALPHAARVLLTALAVLRGGEVIVPSLPAFRLHHLVRAALTRWTADRTCPPLATQWHLRGLRPGGERMYEVLMTPEESARAVCVSFLRLGGQALEGYVVEPESRSWERAPWSGDLVPEGFSLRSDAPPAWISVEDLLASFVHLDEGLRPA